MIPTSKTAPDGNPWAVFSICIDEAALILVIFQLDFLFFKDCVLGPSFWIILSTFLKQRDPHKAIIVFCNKEVRHGVVKMILQKIVGFDFWKAFFFKVAKYQLITIQVIFQIIKNGQARSFENSDSFPTKPLLFFLPELQETQPLFLLFWWSQYPEGTGIRQDGENAHSRSEDLCSLCTPSFLIQICRKNESDAENYLQFDKAGP